MEEKHIQNFGAPIAIRESLCGLSGKDVTITTVATATCEKCHKKESARLLARLDRYRTE